MWEHRDGGEGDIIYTAFVDSSGERWKRQEDPKPLVLNDGEDTTCEMIAIVFELLR